MNKRNGQNIPLTQSQLLLWAGQQLNPNMPLYNVPYSFEISGPIIESVFVTSFQELINRVDILRTVFGEIDGVPYQSVLPQVAYTLNILQFNSNTAKKDADSWMSERSQHLFDLSKPLFDSALLKVGVDRHIWFLNIHHLVTDATSSTILFDLMSVIYSYIKKNCLKNLAKTPSYADYVFYEAQQLKSDQNVDIRTYWKNKVNGFIDTPKFYGTKKKIVGTQAKRVSTKLNKTLTKQLKELAARPEFRSWTTDLSIFNIIATVLLVYIYRVSGQKKLAIGTPVHNRTSKQFKNTVGLFIEVLPLTIELSNDDTFNTAIQRTKAASNEFLRYAEIGATNALVNRTFNTVFNYIHASFSDFDGLPTKTHWIHPEHCDPAHHLRCHLYDMDASGEMDLVFDLSTTVFNEHTRAHLPGHFLNLLEAVLKDINLSIEKPSLLTEHEAASVSLKGEVTEISTLSSAALFEKNVADAPNSVALQLGNETLTYSEVNKKVNQLAHYLQRKGICNGKRVALYFYRGYDYIISLLAVLKVGGTFIPIAADQPASRIEFIISNSGCALILTEVRLKGNIKNESVSILDVSSESEQISEVSNKNLDLPQSAQNIAYILYTSGSTGNPKGVLISNHAISNYLFWAREFYKINNKSVFPLFTSIGFDLTITSTLLPLLNGGKLIIYKEAGIGPDISLFQVLGANLVNCIKLTPSHLQFLNGRDLSKSLLKTMIVGGENFKTELAKSIHTAFGGTTKIYNEYGPTEATVGCIVTEFFTEKHTNSSVAIGKPITNVTAYILDNHKNQVPQGVIGELYIGGAGLAEGYLGLSELTQEKFIENPFHSNTIVYRTGDLVRLNDQQELEYLGRTDEQVKLKGFRIELSDIESNLTLHDDVDNCAVVLQEAKKVIAKEDIENCTECGLPSNYPSADLDAHGVCHLCNAFKGYKHKAQRYFKTESELHDILVSQRDKNLNYDCLALLSGGKDSTYVLAQLVNMGLRVLAFSLDNGYISEQAKTNIDRVVQKLGVDHVYGETEHMNNIFVDSLHRHHNVCNGCFKTIYTLSTKIALEKQIPFVVTGLSRGQFFETRLTEELFWNENVDVGTIDDTILEARKLYHQEEDAVKTHLDVSMFNHDDTFNKVQFVDFYRYSNVSLEKMLIYLKEKVGWVRPTDTGRSTNCLINQVGIYVHTKQMGYSNYSFPYSWDVRMGHKTRTETLEEINEVIDVKEVKRIMGEIGYQEPNDSELDQDRLVGYYTGEQKTNSKKLKAYLKKKLPDYMVPSHLIFMDELPLTSNGKVDKKTLKALNGLQQEMDTPFVAPAGEIQELLATIWKEVLRLKQVGAHDDFIALGGHSLAAIRVTARINEELELKFPLNKIFELPTITEYAKFIEETLIVLLEN